MADLHGENGSIDITYGDASVKVSVVDGKATVSGANTITINGVEMVFTGAHLTSDGKWEVNYSYVF